MRIAKAVLVARETSDLERWPGFGFGARALLPVANRPALFHSLDGLAAAGVEQVAVVVSDGTRDAVRAEVGDGRAWRIALEYLEASSDEGLVDVLRGAESFVDQEPFLVQEGDALVHDGIGKPGDRFTDEGLDALVLRLRSSRRPRRAEARDPVAPTLAAFGGCFLRPAALEAACDRGLDLPALLARVREVGGRVGVQQVDGSLLGRGGRNALLDANRQALERLAAEPVLADVHQSELQGAVRVHPTARVHRSLVRGPAIIGPGTEIREAYVGPYTSLGANVVIEGCEVEHSIVLDGAEIRFVGPRLEASIVGRHARIARDYALPHAVRVVVADRAEITLA